MSIYFRWRYFIDNLDAGERLILVQIKKYTLTCTSGSRGGSNPGSATYMVFGKVKYVM